MATGGRRAAWDPRARGAKAENWPGASAAKREGGRESGVSPGLSTDWTLLRNLLPELTRSLYFPEIVRTGAEKTPLPYLHH